MKSIAIALSTLMLATPALAAPLPVTASFSILGDMVQQVGGDKVAVTSIVGPDEDTHVYEPTPGDVKKLLAGKAFFVNGLGFEGWMQRLVQSSGYAGQVVVATTGIAPRQLDEDGKTYDLSGQAAPLMDIMRILKANNIPVQGTIDIRSNPAVRQQVMQIVRAAGRTSAPASGQPSSEPARSVADRLTELDTLRDSGTITDAEYTAKRQQIISEL